MKKLIITSLVLFLVSLTSAQSLLDLIRAELRAEREEIMIEVLELTEAQAEAFWPVFQQYEIDQAELMDARLADLEKYIDLYMQLTDDRSKDILKEYFEHNKKQAKLDKKYSKKFMKVIPPQQVVRFFQANSQINHLVQLRVSAAIPYVEKLDLFEK